MVSRRKILSRSRDDLNLDDEYNDYTDKEDDCWYSREKLVKDHIEEILRKWDSIDDEIWAKAIVMERNRRVAKAYARAPVLTINGGTGGFDGFRLGMNGFVNPMRDPKTEEFKANIGLGAKVKMDESGNVLIKRLSKSSVFVKNSPEDSAVSNDIIKMPNGSIDIEKPFKLFDMRKFQQNINRELRRTNPDRSRLEAQCVTPISFVKNEPELLDSPVWVLIINVVALEMLKAKFPQVSRVPLHQMPTLFLGGKARLPLSGSSDEDPYSLTRSGSSDNSSGKNKREMEKNKKQLLGPKNWVFNNERNWSATQDRKRDRSRDKFLDDEPEVSTLKPRPNRRRLFKKSEEKEKIDDPYYCGFTARVPKFVHQAAATSSKPPAVDNHNSRQEARVPKYREPGVLGQTAQSAPNLSQIPAVQPFWWHSRLYPDNKELTRSKGPLIPSYPSRPNFQEVAQTRNFSSQDIPGYLVGPGTPRLGPTTPMMSRHNNRHHKLQINRQAFFRTAWE